MLIHMFLSKTLAGFHYFVKGITLGTEDAQRTNTFSLLLWLLIPKILVFGINAFLRKKNNSETYKK